MNRVLLLLLATLALTPLGARAESGRTDRIRLGPSLALAVPHPITLSLEARLNPSWSSSLALGGLKIPVGRRDAATKINVGIAGVDLRGRWHPWEGAFFLGALLGEQSISGEASQTFTVAGQSIPARVAVGVRSTYVTPHLGWIAVFDSGFTLGFELGWQFPFNPRATLEVEITHPSLVSYLDQLQATAEYRALEGEVENAVRPIGRVHFPHVTVLRVGWLF